MIIIQILFVALFTLNLLLLWAAVLSGRFIFYRFVAYPLMLIVPLITVFFDQPRFELDYFWWKVAGIIAILLGIIISAWAMKELNSSEAKWHDTLPKSLVTSGPYQYVRHPIYLGLIFILVGWWWIWAAVYSFYFGMFILALIWIQGYLEEKLILEKQFGNKYKEYRQQTGMYWIK